MTSIPAGYIHCHQCDQIHKSGQNCGGTLKLPGQPTKQPIPAHHEPAKDSLTPKTWHNSANGVSKESGVIIELTINGKILGGKNNMIVTRTGAHIPKRSWKKWRDQAVQQIRAQLPIGWTPINTPVSMTLIYVAGDRRRRDMPAIADSIFHCMEKAGVVTDDTLIWITSSIRSYDKDHPGAWMGFRM